MAICWVTRFVGSDFYFDGKMLPWLALTYATLFATLYAYNAYSWAGKRVSPAITTVYNTLQPVGTCVLSFIIMGTVVNIAEILGGLLVMLGLVVTVYGRQKEMKTHPVPPRGMSEGIFGGAGALVGVDDKEWVMIGEGDEGDG
jgi:drug/metabolite transporter (DMT)-like permease